MSFLKLLSASKEESRSNVCIGLDLAVYGSRKEKTLQIDEEKTEVILNLIDSLYPYCCSFKVNRQYILDLSVAQIQNITAKAHEYNRPIIVDHKISDIGPSNEQMLYHCKQEGFDAFTASPFPGNVKEICTLSHSFGLSSLILVLMSNPEAEWMKRTTLNGIPLYKYLARLTNKYAQGAVVGAAGHVGMKELKIIAEEISGKVILSPGVGAQGGEVKNLLTAFKDDVIFNIGRGIIYHKNPVEEIKKYNKSIESIYQSLGL
ncbi:MAG: orotidine 5'-phosphate decarboxylase [Candidatus Heimdallarchaeota archaeon]|nr:MAG: orotidine 5'-phosphate decarboxylase [Candidatus Heimdallarchaeota archaeon]